MNSFYSQSFSSDFVCFYNLDFKRNDKSSSSEEFILLLNKKQNKTCFLSSTLFVMDSLKRVHPNDYFTYGTEYPEIVIYENKTFTVLEDIIDYKYFYSEPINLKWQILKDKKKIGKLNTQLATCKAYGRNWYAWFCSDLAYNYGPYKFNGLPGLIVSLYDSNKTFEFKMLRFKKKTINYNLPKIKNYKSIEKNKFYKTRFKIHTADNGAVIFKNLEEKKKWMDAVKRRWRTSPLFDIEYPQE